jgi:hypothetical protein
MKCKITRARWKGGQERNHQQQTDIAARDDKIHTNNWRAAAAAACFVYTHISRPRARWRKEARKEMEIQLDDAQKWMVSKNADADVSQLERAGGTRWGNRKLRQSAHSDEKWKTGTFHSVFSFCHPSLTLYLNIKLAISSAGRTALTIQIVNPLMMTKWRTQRCVCLCATAGGKNCRWHACKIINQIILWCCIMSLLLLPLPTPITFSFISLTTHYHCA